MKIAVISTRGIPNNYGGFEQFAENISVDFVARGHEVVVYSPSYHPYKKNNFKGVRIKHIYSPEVWIGGSVGSYFYDFASFRDALKCDNFDIIYVLGFTSIIPAYIWYDIKKRKYPIVITNMDGLENKRSKFSPWVRKFLNWEEKMAVKHSHYLVADNIGIRNYYNEKYGKESEFLAYGAVIKDDNDNRCLKDWGLEENDYYLLIARQEPENNIEMIIDGYLHSKENGKRLLIVVGKVTTPYGKNLVVKYSKEKFVRFVGAIFDYDILNSMRHFSRAYFHGHSVGGTNPSLLEAMASKCFILAHSNDFNRSVLKDNAFYFQSSADVTELLNRIEYMISNYKQQFSVANLNEIRNEYSWERIVNKYEEYFKRILFKYNIDL